MTGERDDALPAGDRALLDATIADPAMPDYLAIRALAVLAQDDRLARFTAMGHQFVAEARRRLREDGAAALLADPPNVHERILELATRQIVTGGRGGLTMWVLAREADVPRRTLYNAYSTSGELAEACRRRAQTIWRARFERRVLAADARAARRLLATVEAIGDWVASDRFRDDEALRAGSAAAGDERADDLHEHLTEIDRFATGLAVEARIASPHAFGAFVATMVAGAAAWVHRRDTMRNASIAYVERLIVRARAP